MRFPSLFASYADYTFTNKLEHALQNQRYVCARALLIDDRIRSALWIDVELFRDDSHSLDSELHLSLHMKTDHWLTIYTTIGYCIL